MTILLRECGETAYQPWLCFYKQTNSYQFWDKKGEEMQMAMEIRDELRHMEIFMKYGL